MSYYPPEREAVDPSLLRSLWHYRVSSLLIVLQCALLGTLASQLLGGSPTAQAEFAVSDPRGNQVLTQGVTSESSFDTYTAQRAAFAESDTVLERAQEILADLGLRRDPAELRTETSTSTAADGAIITVQATGSDGEEAAATADAIVRAYRERTVEDLQQQQRSALTALEEARQRLIDTQGDGPAAIAAAEALAQLEVRASDLAVDVSTFGDGTRFVDSARVTTTGWLLRVARGTAIGAAVGLLLALTLAYVRSGQNVEYTVAVDPDVERKRARA